MRFRYLQQTLLGALFLGAAIGPAHAQNWPCPGGPGPGEVQIGVMGGSHGIAATPLCAAFGDGGSDDDGGSYTPPREPDAFMSVVTHQDTSALWVSTGYPTEDLAELTALEACTRTMGKGCHAQWYGYNDFSISVVQDAAGLLFMAGNVNASAARTSAMNSCREYSDTCKQTRLITNSRSPRDSFPRGRPALHRYAVIAWPASKPPSEWLGKVWLVSGVEGFDQAVAAAVARCKADTGIECVRGQHSTSGVLARSVDGAGKVYWIDATNDEAAGRRVASTCLENEQCRLVDTFKASEQQTMLITEIKSDQPRRGFYAVYWPPNATGKAPLAIVTGQPSLEAARRAAKALCEKTNRGACESFIDGDDWGTEQVIKTLTDSAGAIRIQFGYSQADVDAKMEASCRRDNATCGAGRTIDLTKPASLSIEP